MCAQLLWWDQASSQPPVLRAHWLVPESRDWQVVLILVVGGLGLVTARECSMVTVDLVLPAHLVHGPIQVTGVLGQSPNADAQSEVLPANVCAAHQLSLSAY